jgi:hypothetical protein
MISNIKTKYDISNIIIHDHDASTMEPMLPLSKKNLRLPLNSVDYVIKQRMRGFGLGTRYRPRGLGETGREGSMGDVKYRGDGARAGWTPGDTFE